MEELDQSALLAIIAGLAPDRMATITTTSHLVEDLGYDSPRKMELVATLESHLNTQLHEPTEPIETVNDVLQWVKTNTTQNT